MPRAMVLHSSLCWKHGIDRSLWSMAVKYTTHVYNHLVNDKGITPDNLFTGSTIPRHTLKDPHVFGCPVYMLDPVLQAVKKLPRWIPQHHRGIFAGFSPKHSSNVPFILKLQTETISPQYHVVFDDTLTTVESIPENEDPPSFCNQRDIASHTLRIPLNPDSVFELQDN